MKIQSRVFTVCMIKSQFYLFNHTYCFSESQRKKLLFVSRSVRIKFIYTCRRSSQKNCKIDITSKSTVAGFILNLLYFCLKLKHVVIIVLKNITRNRNFWKLIDKMSMKTRFFRVIIMKSAFVAKLQLVQMNILLLTR